MKLIDGQIFEQIHGQIQELVKNETNLRADH